MNIHIILYIVCCSLCPISINFGFSRQIFMKSPNKFHLDTSSGNRADTCRQTVRQTDVMKTTDAFCDCANVPKNCRIRSAVKTSELNDIQFRSTHSLLQHTLSLCSLIFMDVLVKHFIRSLQDFSTDLRQYVAA